MPERSLRGTPASPGVAVGRVLLLASGVDDGPAGDPVAEASRARAALSAAGSQLASLAADLRRAGREEEAEIVETGVLMAADPELLSRTLSLVDAGRPAAGALVQAAESVAAVLASLPDAMLAARADDVRSVGRRAARLAGAARDDAPATRADVVDAAPAQDLVVVADDLGPADVAELPPGVVALALAAGGVTAHAAIVARSRGLPLVVGIGEGVLSAEPGARIVVDADAGSVVLDPGAERVADYEAVAGRRAAQRRRAVADRELPAETTDGRRVRVLANVAGPAEVAEALACGAEGAGLIRTELAFLDAHGWPSEDDHRRHLSPVLDALRGLPATVRVLDFGADKTPPFLRGTSARGLALLLEEPERLAIQLRAALDAGRGTDLRILLPMVASADEVARASALLGEAAADAGVARPPLGAMVETPEAAEAAVAIVSEADFLSIGTNDLTHSTLGQSRFGSEVPQPHHPRVLAHIAACAEAAHAAGTFLEVCGEAASHPITVPLLVGLGVDELSAGAARVGVTRAWIRSLSGDDCRGLASRALAAADAAEVAALVAPVAESLGAIERGDAPVAAR